MTILIKLLTVLSISAIELWGGIPAGLALNLHPLAVGITAAAGAILAVLIVVTLGDRLRGWLLGRYGGTAEGGRAGRIRQVWNRYGVVGLGLLSPLVTGGPLGAVLGLSLGAPARGLLLWMSLGIILWSAVLTGAAYLGFAGVKALLR